MMGQKGASLETTRKIHRKMTKDLAAYRELLQRKQQRPNYNAASCLTAEVVRGLEKQLSGEATPVAILPAIWKQVCREFNKRNEES